MCMKNVQSDWPVNGSLTRNPFTVQSDSNFLMNIHKNISPADLQKKEISRRDSGVHNRRDRRTTVVYWVLNRPIR